MEKILLVDGNSILNRGFYALPLLSNKDGIYTNAILGFLNILIKVMEDEKPDYLTVAFDVHAPTFRHKMYSEYKGTRKPMPEELKMQLPIIREVLSAMNVNVVEMAGYEADDLLGTIAKKSEKLGLLVTLLSGDRDLLQIASNNIKIAIPKTSMGKTETHLYFENDVISEYGVTPTEFIEVKALQGDTSDNIPGVPKVGPKTATELIQKYHTLEALYENVDDITKKALHENLVNNKEQAFFSRVLSRIEIESPIEPDLDKSKNIDLLNDKSMDVLLKYSLKSIVSKLESFEGNNASLVTENQTYEVSYSIIEDFNETTDIINKIKKSKSVAIYGQSDNGIAVGLDKEQIYYIKPYGLITYDYLVDELSKALSFPGKVITFNIKNSYDYLVKYSDNLEDIELMSYLIDPVRGAYEISYIASNYLSKYLKDEKTLVTNSEEYAATVVSLCFETYSVLNEKLEKLSMSELYRKIEMPLSFVLYSMEKEGILVDKEKLIEYGNKLKIGISELEKVIYEQAGLEFNINSPKQLGEVLFEKLGLKGGKKTKTGYSTAADVLEKLATENKIVADVLEYRALSKLNSTYAEGLQSCIKEDGRIHSHFNQTITATGRISSTDPNLQNIPIRTELGRELRKVFYPKEGFVFVDADYSQIELRLMAHMSSDSNLIDAYKSGKDIHRSTASLVFNIPFEEVTSEQRRNAKSVNFGIIYGISAFGLSQDIGCSVGDAKKYIDDYFETFPAVKKYLDDTVNKAKEDGYTKTLFNRIRPIPELKSSNFMQRSFGERVAMNAPLQGTAADIMKIAMINVFNRLNSENLESKMLIQVHDEILIETKVSELDKVMSIVEDEMTKAAKLSVDLEVDAHSGSTWYDAK